LSIPRTVDDRRDGEAPARIEDFKSIAGEPTLAWRQFPPYSEAPFPSGRKQMSETWVERRLAAILAADVAGYSRLMGQDEEGTLAALKAIQRELSDP
jgi:class 3 adenylate cyclase